MTSRLDAVYRSILITKFFTKGWGKPENLRRLFEFRKTVSNRDECFKLIDPDYPVTITKEETSGDCRLIEGHFLTPLEKFLPGIVPPAAQKAHFQAIIPLSWPQPDFRPMCIHLAGTGDHYFWRRRQLMAKPLLKEANIGGIILENPFYGLRKPSDQIRSSLHNVSDIFVMGGCLILESLVLMHWCERNKLGPLGVTGLSMGGHMASLAATNWPKPLVLVPCLSWSTASAVFLQGVMSQSINWDLLEDQYLSDGDYREKLSKMVTVVDAAFLAGKKFAQKVSETVETTIQPEDLKSNVIQTKVEKEIKTDKNLKTNVDKTVKSNEEIFNPKETVSDEIISAIKINESAALADLIRSKIENGGSEKPSTDNKFEMLKNELKRLSAERIISRSLYEKLSSNERFELQSNEVDELNRLNKDILSNIRDKGSLEKVLLNGNEAKIQEINFKQQEHIDLPRAYYNPNIAVTTTTEAQPRKPEVTKKTPAKVNPPKEVLKSRSISEITADIVAGFPFVKTNSKKIDISKIHWRDREALQFMRGVMDEFTHLSNFSVPYDTSLIIAVCAKHDAYVPRDDVGTLEEIWPGAEVRYVDAGHVSAYLLHQSLFRSCIVEAFERSRKKWKDGKHIV